MSALGSEDHGHFQSLSRVLRLRFPQEELSFKSSVMEDGLVEYLITWVPFNASTNLRLNIDEQTLEIATTSTSLQLPTDAGEALAVFLSKLQEDIPFGHMHMDIKEGQVYYRTGQYMGGIGDSEELMYFHLFMHYKLYPLLNVCFRSALSESFNDRLTERILLQLRTSITQANLDL